LLANGSETKFVSRQLLGKHALVAIATHAIIEILLETVFSASSVQRDYKEDICGNLVSSVRECEGKGSVGMYEDFGSKRIVIVRSRYQETSSEEAAGWKYLGCVTVTCKVWR
jgi:hypothetical protein